MNFKVFLLAPSTIAVGLVELIVGGILPQIANDLDISIVSAGQLISVLRWDMQYLGRRFWH